MSDSDSMYDSDADSDSSREDADDAGDPYGDDDGLGSEGEISGSDGEQSGGSGSGSGSRGRYDDDDLDDDDDQYSTSRKGEEIDDDEISRDSDDGSIEGGGGSKGGDSRSYASGSDGEDSRMCNDDDDIDGGYGSGSKDEDDGGGSAPSDSDEERSRGDEVDNEVDSVGSGSRGEKDGGISGSDEERSRGDEVDNELDSLGGSSKGEKGGGISDSDEERSRPGEGDDEIDNELDSPGSGSGSGSGSDSRGEKGGDVSDDELDSRGSGSGSGSRGEKGGGISDSDEERSRPEEDGIDDNELDSRGGEDINDSDREDDDIQGPVSDGEDSDAGSGARSGKDSASDDEENRSRGPSSADDSDAEEPDTVSRDDVDDASVLSQSGPESPQTDKKTDSGEVSDSENESAGSLAASEDDNVARKSSEGDDGDADEDDVAETEPLADATSSGGNRGDSDEEEPTAASGEEVDDDSVLSHSSSDEAAEIDNKVGAELSGSDSDPEAGNKPSTKESLRGDISDSDSDEEPKVKTKSYTKESLGGDISDSDEEATADKEPPIKVKSDGDVSDSESDEPSESKKSPTKEMADADVTDSDEEAEADKETPTKESPHPKEIPDEDVSDSGSDQPIADKESSANDESLGEDVFDSDEEGSNDNEPPTKNSSDGELSDSDNEEQEADKRPFTKESLAGDVSDSDEETTSDREPASKEASDGELSESDDEAPKAHKISPTKEPSAGDVSDSDEEATSDKEPPTKESPDGELSDSDNEEHEASQRSPKKESADGDVSDSDEETTSDREPASKEASDGELSESDDEAPKAHKISPIKEPSAGDVSDSDEEATSDKEPPTKESPDGELSDSDKEEQEFDKRPSTNESLAGDVSDSDDEATADKEPPTKESSDGELSDADSDEPKASAAKESSAGKPTKKESEKPKKLSTKEAEKESDEREDSVESGEADKKDKNKKTPPKREEKDKSDREEDLDESESNDPSSEEESSDEAKSGGDMGMSEITQKQRNTSATVKKASSKGSQDDDSSSSSGSDYWVQKVKAASHTQISGAITNFYSIQDLIEKGKFASVYSCVNKETGDSRAAKEMKKSEENEANNKLVLNEFKILKDLDHRNLNNVYELFENDQYYFLITDNYKAGDLRVELAKSGLFSERRAADLMRQILGCVDYIHSKGVVHRDIKPSNILLDDKGKNKVRIIGFGVATQCGEGERLTEPAGTVLYMAPEVLGMNYGKQCDIWSIGVVLFLILSGQQPFKGATNEESFMKIVNGEYSFSDSAWEKVSNDAKDLIQKLLTWEESSRPTAAQALKHPWIVSKGKSRTIKDLEPRKAKAAKSPEPKKTVEEPPGPKTTVEEPPPEPNKTVEEPPESKETVEEPPKPKKNDEKEVNVDPHTMLKVAACYFLASHLLPKAERTKLNEIFGSVRNKNGKLAIADAKKGYNQFLGSELSDDEVAYIFRRVDSKSKGVLEYPEFIYGAMDLLGLLDQEKLFKSFPIFAANGSVSIQELKDLLNNDLSLDKKAVKSIASEIEKDTTYPEFLALVGLPAFVVDGATKNQQNSSTPEEKKPDSEDSGSSEEASDSIEEESDMNEGESNDNNSSYSLKVHANNFISHRLGKLTEHYEVLDYIAKGSYGVVCSALHKDTNTIRAIKELKKSKKNKEKNELLLKEFHILKKLDHPNILQMHELFEDKKHYYIVTGVSNGGDLHSELKRRGKFAEDDAAVLIRQILICVNYCHKMNIVHRDLKPGNVLLEEHKNLNHIKVIDFGEAIEAEPSTKLTEISGTMAYMAPEVLGMSYGQKCDVWSVGVIAYLVLSGQQPLKGADDQETFNNIVKGAISYEDPLWKELSEEAIDFVKKLLTWDQNLRPTAANALKHPWFARLRRTTSVELRNHTIRALSNLETFDAQSKLRVATCTFIATQLMNKEEKEKIDDVFRAMDINNDGTLNKEEVRFGYEKYFDRKLSDEEIDAIFKHVDADGTGELEYSEFLFGALDKQNLLSPENLKRAFSIFDKDGSGDITMDELKELLRGSLSHDDSVDERALNKLIAQVDSDGDGKISYEEFVNMAMGSPDGLASSPKRTNDETSRKQPLAEEPPEASERSEDSRSLQKAIVRASQQQTDAPSKRDPPVFRHGRTDPPDRDAPVKTTMSPPDPSSSGEPAPKPVDLHLKPLPVLPKTMQHGSINNMINKPKPIPAILKASRVSPKVAKIDQACEGFDRVQEKIARLRMLLSAQECPGRAAAQQPLGLTAQGQTRRGPNVESLDSAFAKLSQIQSKMRSLQALVKSNQRTLERPSAVKPKSAVQ